jgi:outer membrane protein TolC
MPRFLTFAALSFLVVSVHAEETRVSLDLTGAMTRAAEVQVGAVRSRERLKQAVSQAEAARASLLPRVDAQVSEYRQTRNLEAQGIAIPNMDPLVGPFNSFDARVYASMPLFDREAISRFQQASAYKTLALREQKLMRQDAMLLGASLYLGAKRAESAVRAADAAVALAETQDKIARSRFESGAGSRLERDRADAELTSAQARAGDAKAAAEDRRRDLCVALQYSAFCQIQFADEENFPDVVKSSEAVQWPEVERAQAALLERKANLRAAKSSRLPRVTVSGDYGASGKEATDTEETYSFGAKASLPIYEGGRIKSENQTAASAVTESEAVVRDAELRSEAAAEAARAAAIQRELEFKARASEYDVAADQLTTTQKSNEAGSVSAVDLVAAQSRAAMAKDAMTAADAAYKLSVLEWARSEGRVEEFINRETN